MLSTRVRRRVIACARCRARKIVCDAASPSCAKCTSAGVPCVAVTPSSQGPTPRSIVQFLEDELARREANGVISDHLRGNGAGTGADASHSWIDRVIADYTPPFLGLTGSIPLLRCTVAGSRLPSTSTSDPTYNGHERPPSSTLDSMSGATRLADIPVSVADFLFDNYLKRVAKHSPIFYTSDVVTFFNSVFHHPLGSVVEPGALAGPYETYAVSLIMAISLTTSARSQQLRANSIAIGFFKTAMQHIQAVCTNDLRGFQAILLLCEYAFLNPSVANVWLLPGFTTQMCIDLGLHQETAEDLKLDPLTLDIRRRVFWCAYETDIATSGALIRPTVFLSQHINVQFPSEIADSSISAAGIDPNGERSKVPSIRIWKYRQLEAEIISVLFHNGPILPDQDASFEAWMLRMETEINQWRDEVHWWCAVQPEQPTSDEMSLYADIAHAYIIVTLYRPAPRVKNPSGGNLMKTFTAAVNVAKGYLTQTNLGFGYSKYVFHSCYHTFSAAVVFLQALERCKELVCPKYTIAEVEDLISLFSRFFATIAERWPAVLRCMEEFERLMVPVKRKYIDFALHHARTSSSELLDAGSLLDQTGTSIECLLNPEYSMDFGSLFPHDVFNVQEDLVELPFTIPSPSDWGIEFNLDVDI